MEEKIFRSHNMVNFQSAKFIWPAIGTADADKIRYNFLKLLFNREVHLMLPLGKTGLGNLSTTNRLTDKFFFLSF